MPEAVARRGRLGCLHTTRPSTLGWPAAPCDGWDGFKPSIFISTESCLLANPHGAMETGSERFPGTASGEQGGVLTKPRSSAAGPSLTPTSGDTALPLHPRNGEPGFDLTLSRKTEAESTPSREGGRQVLREEVEHPLVCRLLAIAGVLPVSPDPARTDSEPGTAPGTRNAGQGGAAFGPDRWRLGAGSATSCPCQDTDLLAIRCHGTSGPGSALRSAPPSGRREGLCRFKANRALEGGGRALSPGQTETGPKAHLQTVLTPVRSEEPARRAREDGPRLAPAGPLLTPTPRCLLAALLSSSARGQA